MEAKSYAVRCTTEEQVRECEKNKIFHYYDPTNSRPIKRNYTDSGYTVITYDEAISLGLLGEKNVCKSCLGKKQHSVYKGDKVLQPDFIGDGRYLLEGEGITMVDCSRCKGTGLEPEYMPEDEPSLEELVKFGYAPGLYTYGKCSDCGCKLEMVEKRAWRCRECAIKASKESQKVEPVRELKLLGTDTEDGITCEVRGYWKDGICYIKDVINKRTEDAVKESPSDNQIVNQMAHSLSTSVNKHLVEQSIIKESPIEDNLVEKIMKEIIKLLPGNYSCTRVWGAWQYGTMGESDFIPLRENEEFIEEIRNTIKKHLS